MRLRDHSLLTAGLNDAILGARVEAQLPDRATWPQGHAFLDHGQGDSPMSRFADGIFTVTLPDGRAWTGDGGGDRHKAGPEIGWDIEVETDDGGVYAVPRTTGFKLDKKEGTHAEFAAAIGLEPRRIARLGKLVPLFGENDEPVAAGFRALGLPYHRVYVQAAGASIMRAEFLHLLRGP